ncbi:MAG: radical SAM protein [Promethearchaeota archaeon]
MSPPLFGSPHFLEPPVFRPPSEAYSLILQATLGCSHNKCTFCGSYRTKQFRTKPFETFRAEVEHLAREQGVRPQRIFLADGDALVLSTEKLLRILGLLYKEFPGLERVTIYGSADNARHKSDAELRQLHQAGLGMVYIGLESGDDEVLRRVNKGASNQDHINACRRMIEAGLKVSVIIILGLGGTELSRQHATHTAATLNTIDPPYLAALTLMLVPGTELHAQAQAGTFDPLNPLETLHELRQIIDGLTDLTSCVFRTNHASNYLQLRGVLSRDRTRLLEEIDAVLAQPETARHLRPEFLRRL